MFLCKATAHTWGAFSELCWNPCVHLCFQNISHSHSRSEHNHHTEHLCIFCFSPAKQRQVDINEAFSNLEAAFPYEAQWSSNHLYSPVLPSCSILSILPGPAPSAAPQLFPVPAKPQGSGRRLCLHLTGKGCTAASWLCLALATKHLTFEPDNQQLHGQSAETIQSLYETHLLSSSRPTSSSHVQSSVSIIRQYYYHLIKIFLPQFSLKMIINYPLQQLLSVIDATDAESTSYF